MMTKKQIVISKMLPEGWFCKRERHSGVLRIVAKRGRRPIILPKGEEIGWVYRMLQR